MDVTFGRGFQTLHDVQRRKHEFGKRPIFDKKLVHKIVRMKSIGVVENDPFWAIFDTLSSTPETETHVLHRLQNSTTTKTRSCWSILIKMFLVVSYGRQLVTSPTDTGV